MSTAATATAIAEPHAKASPAVAPSPSPSLDDRVLAALRDHAGSAEIRALIAEAEAALVSAETQHAAARERAIDPTTPGEAVAEARRIMEDRAFIAERMREAGRRLRDELKTAEAREATERHQAEVAAYTDDRDALVRALREHYPAAVETLTTLFRWIENTEAERQRLGLGMDESAEVLARGVPGNFYVSGRFVARLASAQLPTFDGPGHAWPR